MKATLVLGLVGTRFWNSIVGWSTPDSNSRTWINHSLSCLCWGWITLFADCSWCCHGDIAHDAWGIAAGCLSWCLNFDWYQCQNHRGNHSALAPTKKAHFLLILIRRSLKSLDIIILAIIWLWWRQKTFYQIEFSHTARASWQFPVACKPSQLWNKLFPSLFTSYFLSH